MHRPSFRFMILSTLALVFAAVALQAAAQSMPAKDSSTSLRDWWKNAVIYEIYPRSFQDSDGDGIGDLKGITQRLDYLKDLGIDAIWLTPCYPSPQVDFGYDISDFKKIDPQYGTMADFDHLVAEANKRHIRVIMDMVMNHTSDKHKWFLESRSSRTNPYRDWYVWHDGKGQTATSKGLPPNNWISSFGHSGWEWDEKTRQYYYHKFYIQQPDVNWENPKMHEAFKDIIRFWLDRGVGGFRFDAITTLYEDPSFADEPLVKDEAGNPVLNEFGDQKTDKSNTVGLPGFHTVMNEVRVTSDAFPSTDFPGTRVLIGETYPHNIGELAAMYGTRNKPELHLPMDMQIGIINKLDVSQFRARISEVETGIHGNVPLIVFDNHDNPRLDVRYGDGVHDTEIQRVISTLLFATQGAAMFYYGDELGMQTTPPTRKEDVQDPIGVTGWPKEKGRDGERTPMQWDAKLNAGFSKAKPWLPIPPSATTLNVQAEKIDSNSLFNWYKQLIQLKKTNAPLARGTTVMLDPTNTKVLSWTRTTLDEESVLVTVNFTAEPQVVSLSTAQAVQKPLKTLLKSPGTTNPASLNHIELGPFGVYIGQILNK